MSDGARRRVVAVLHVLVWLAAAASPPAGSDETSRLISLILLLGVLGLVPVGAGLLDRATARVPGPAGWAAPAWLAAVSLSVPPGPAAAALALPWLGLAVWLVLRIVPARRGRWREADQLAAVAALLSLVAGALCLVFSRLGLRPLDVESVVVLATAVHFHFAGFCVLVIVSRLRDLTPAGALSVYRPAAVGAVVGTPVMVGGILFSGLLELAGAVLLVVSLLGLAGLLLFVIVPELDSWLPQTLLGASAGFLAIGMVLAAGYAVAEFEALPILPIPQMAALHGIANGVGFSTLGLAGLWLLDRKAGSER